LPRTLRSWRKKPEATRGLAEARAEKERTREKLDETFSLVEAAHKEKKKAVAKSIRRAARSERKLQEKAEVHVEQAIAEAKEELSVLRSAFKSAEDSRYKAPKGVYRVLVATKKLAVLNFDSKRRRSVGPWDDFFRQGGFDFTMYESPTTLSMLASQRSFLYGGKNVLTEKHLTLGGFRGESPSFFLRDCESEEKFLIGDCGEHRDYARMST